VSASLPLLTADLPPAGGAVKIVPEDFVVEEVPAYEPCGLGEHLYLWIEKRGLDTVGVVRELSAALGVPERDVGYAGLKDRQGVTRQWFSVPAAGEAKLAALQGAAGIRVLAARRHGNKLRTGHLRGNLFRIRIREVRDPGAALACFERLGQQGVPNYFGEQRFGRQDDNATAGRMLLRGERLPRAPTAFLRRLYLSAWQSLLFNRALAQRVEEGSFRKALLGDVLRKTDTGGLFVCEDPAVDQPRVDGFEVTPTGPLFGPKMTQAAHQVKVREDALLAEEGLTLTDLRRGRGETEGARRPYAVALEQARLTPDGADLLLELFLPRGSYATVVLRELLKV
jgi:tRNA pseudouridine13 synthase